MTRSQRDLDVVLQHIAEGRTDTEIARLTDIPRSTVRDWRAGLCRSTSRPRGSADFCDHDLLALPPDHYCYLLGMYLGDGYIARHRRGVWKLMITSDSRYPGIINECSEAMQAMVPSNRVGVYRRTSRCVDVSMWWKHWPCLFPQHGPGRKHERTIALARWQEELLSQATERFIRGLIHSDGCRIVANDRGVKSVRYHFSNRSEDIKGLFCTSLDRLEIPWTRPCNRQIAIYRKAAVARLDEFVGPKA